MRPTLSVMAVCKVPTAPFVPMCAPYALDQALAAVGAGSGPVVIVARQAKALDSAVGQANGEQRLRGVQDLREQVRRQREGAEVFQHGEAVV